MILKYITGYDKKYAVSSTGEIYSYLTNKYLKPRINASGYAQVVLRHNNKSKEFLVHRLVALTFIPNEANLLEVNHIDKNKLNNSAHNLEWCSRQQNATHGTTKSIQQLDLDGNLICTYESVVSACKALGKTSGAISSCANGHCKTAYGFKWRYANDKTI